MEYFKRVLQYVKIQYRAVLLSVIFAILAAMLLSFSLAAMLPLMKVMIGEEGLHGWVNRTIIKHRSGITFTAAPLAEYINKAAEDNLTTGVKLRIDGIKDDSPAGATNLVPQDEVVAIQFPGQEKTQDIDLDILLEQFASTPAGQTVTLTIEHETSEVEMIDIVLQDPLIYRVYGGSANRLLNYVPRSYSPRFKRDSIILIIILMLVATIARCALRFAQQYLVRKISFRTLMMLRLDAYRNAIRLPLTYYSTQGASDTMSRFMQDSVKILVGITTLLGKGVREPLTIIFLAATSFTINAKMTLIVIAGAPVAALIIGKLGRKMKRATKRSLENWSQLLGQLQQSLQGIRVVKGYHREQYEQEAFTNIHRRLLKQQFRVGKIDAASGPLLEALAMTAASIAMIFAAHLLTRSENKMPISEFTALVILLSYIAESGRKMGNIWPRIQTANAASERIYRLIDAPAETDPPHARPLSPLAESLELRDVTFTYPNSPQPALCNVSLTVRAGRTVAVVGPNGSGKTTLLSLIPRFFVPESGSVLIDGHDINNVTLASLRQQIGIVTQQTVIFNDTIAANIAYGNPDASRQQIITAAQRAYAHEFIENTADKYETIVGEQGVTLSGGQLQRLAIARAILRDPAILIFDEATSQIDSDSEAKIQQAVLEFSRGRTSFIIAHRLSTIINADCILVLDDGRLIAQDRHDKLLETCSLYRQLYQMQFAQPDSTE